MTPQLQFVIKVMASFIVGGSYVALSTRSAEKFGPKVGGILAGLPSTALVGLVFIYLTQDATAAVHSVRAVPAGFGFTLLLISIYAGLRLSGRSLRQSLGLGLVVWLLLASILVLYVPKSLLISIILFALFFISTYRYLRAVPPATAKGFRLKMSELLIRASMAGLVVALAVVLAKISGPYLGGLIAGFPISVLSAIIILDVRRGSQFSVATVRSMPSGLLGNTIFVANFSLLVPWIGMGVGTIIAYLLSLVSALLASKLQGAHAS